ncbi:MAG: glycosyltransferase family 2 protein [Turicibacter sp.]
MKPVISVIVPIYNVECYLQKCLDSLVNQTIQKPYEILCVNDGSPDQSQVIIDEYVLKYPEKVKGLMKENGGLADARNYGLIYATGDYVLFIDSDDWISEMTLENMLNKSLESDACITVCDMEYVYEDGQTKFISGGDFEQTNLELNPYILTINNSACNKMFKKDLFNDIQFPKGLWYEDLGCIPLVLAKAKKIVKLNEVHYFYLQRAGSIMNTPSPKIFDIYEALNLIKIQVAPLDSRFNEVIEFMFIEHGAKLTTQRIREYETNRLEFIKQNVSILNSYYPKWIKNKYIAQYSLKERVLFHLLYLKQIKLVLWLYDRK